ncbi:MAG: DUF418 domain-containing protein [Sphingosinicella sp.]|uniref:DUF418 domain-containing protein n=1 Tax=Sphingosinicella sp. TaxID=1917971 RepID=UPI004037A3B9
MTATTEPGRRIQSLDIVRGIAVMGILAMNIVAFAMPFSAYMNPASFGSESVADYAAWAFNFVLVDGKMRGLFSFLFGASTLLVIERAEAGGQSAAKIHYSRMLWLLVFGLLHFYLIWFGDILAGYALTGLLLFFFRNLKVRALITWGVALVLVQCLLMTALSLRVYQLAGQGTLSGTEAEEWAGFQEAFGRMTPQHLSEAMSLHLGPWTGLVRNQLTEHGAEPFVGIFFFGWETLAYMLFGMAALKTGFFRGEWAAARYRKVALIGLAITIPLYALLAWSNWRAGFTMESTILYSMTATTPLRPIMVFAYAALIILAFRNGGWLADRVAAAGRAAFTNYLGTSLLMTALFYGWGLGLYGSLTRVELYLPVLVMWALMLLWSKPWLDRFRYGPFEWLWRSLARLELQPMRKAGA